MKSHLINILWTCKFISNLRKSLLI